MRSAGAYMRCNLVRHGSLQTKLYNRCLRKLQKTWKEVDSASNSCKLSGRRSLMHGSWKPGPTTETSSASGGRRVCRNNSEQCFGGYLIVCALSWGEKD